MDPINVRGVPMVPWGPSMPDGLQQVIQALMQRRGGGMGAFPAPIPGASPDPSPEELAAASQPAMFGSQPMMGGLGGMVPRMAADAAMAQPFNRPGVPPVPAPGIGNMADVAAARPPMGDPAVTSLDGGGAIPLPRPDPRRGMEAGSRGISAQVPGAPMSLAPPAPMAASPGAAPGMGGGGFRMPSSALLLALGGGLAGAPSFGQAMRRGFSNAAGVAAQDDQRMEQRNLLGTQQTGIIQSLQRAGAQPHEILAAMSSKDALDQVNKKYFGVTEAKAPTMRELKLPNGMIQQEQWNTATRAWEKVGAPAPGSSRERTLSINDIEKMSGEGQRFSQVMDFHKSFKDQYGGYMSATVGDAANTLARNSPWASANAKERADWWQGYQMYKNKVRNEMFGSALTATESAEFTKADITPGMQGDAIRKNLARQQELLQRSIQRKAAAAVKAGYPAESVYSAYGVPPGGAAAAPTSGKTKSGIAFSIVTGDEED